MIRLRRTARWQEHARPAQNKLLHRGRPLTRGTEVAADGGEEVGGLHTSVDAGELVGDSDPDFAPAARVDVIFRREPWPTHRRWETCHRNC